jgi:chemotaxis protein methyltransferase CheR
VIERPWSDSKFEALAAIATARTGLVFPPARRSAVERGMSKAMARAGVPDLDAYGALLASEGAALDDLVTELTVDETYFFREPRHFDFVREVVLPEVLERRGPMHAVRAWSAGCSTGEEAYSLSILFDDAQLPVPPYLLATDISRTSLQTARAAIYGEWSFRGVPEATLERCFHRVHGAHDVPRGARYALAAKFRKRVTFDYLNLAHDPYPALETGTWGMDVILCRNVLIYFDRRTVARVAEHLRRCLADGGWIVTASSDPILSDYTDLERTLTPWGLFYRRGPAPAFFVPRPEPEPNRALALQDLEKRLPPLVLQVAVPEQAFPLALAEAATNGGILAPSTVTAVAQAAMAAGAYRDAVESLRDLGADPTASALFVRALANVEVAEAERACADAVERHPLSVELHYLHAVLLMALARYGDAIRAARRVVYLDGACEIGYFTLGVLLRRTGDLAGARRAYRNARDLLVVQPADALVPLSNGEQAGQLAQLAATELEMLSDTPTWVSQ